MLAQFILLLELSSALSRPILNVFKTKKMVVDVQGILMCNGRSLEETRIVIYNDDSVLKNEMGSDTTDLNGNFKIKALTKIGSVLRKPKLKFYHQCDVGVKYEFLCDLVTEITIDKKLNEQEIADLGTLDVVDYKLATKEHCSWLRVFLP